MSRISRRRAALLAVAGVVIAGAGGMATGVLPAAAGLGAARPAGSSEGSETTTGTSVETADVERRTIEIDRKFEGSLGYEGSLGVSAGSPGTLTWLPEVGTLIERGEKLYELDGTIRPRLLYGSRPMWRTLEPGMSNGSDVQQLEENLVALGYADDRLTVDRHWGSWTTKAVKAWQKAANLPVDGSIDGTDAIFLPGAIRVTDLQGQLGSMAGPGAPVLQGTSATRVVTIDLGADEVDQLAAGTALSIELPDGSEVAGTVRSIGTVASPGEDTGLPGSGGGTATLPVTIDLDDPDAVAAYDQAPVTVHAVIDTREDVLVVPVLAIVALLEGGYAVEVVRDDGSREYVAVDLGLFDGGDVEITGDIAEGDTVVVPS
jgi:peptidoglycan hydrolase-like protein with peptidoglycan-binding domain